VSEWPPATERRGPVVRSARVVGGLEVFNVEYPPFTTLAEHGHECGYLCLVMRGEFEERYLGRPRVGGTGSLLGYRPGDSHEGGFGADGAQVFHVGVSRAYLDGLNRSEWPRWGAPESATLKAHALDLFQSYESGECDLAVELLASDLVAHAAGSRGHRRESHPQWLKRVLALLHDAPPCAASLRQVAREVGRHPSHLAREFRRFTGQTLGAYNRRLRVRRAAAGIAAGDDLAEIALRSGFADQSHFTRVFKRTTGVTPSRFQSGFLGNRSRHRLADCWTDVRRRRCE
jgi:AraC family transcriptional regulator